MVIKLIVESYLTKRQGDLKKGNNELKIPQLMNNTRNKVSSEIRRTTVLGVSLKKNI